MARPLRIERAGVGGYCGLKLGELAAAVELRNDAVVATNAIRYQKRLGQDRAEQAAVRKVLDLLTCKMR